MLLFESPAIASAAGPVQPAPGPGSHDLLPAARPSLKGSTSTCEVMDSPTMAQYLSGEACPPAGFPYQPEAVAVSGGIRMTDPAGSCSSGTLPAVTKDYDFRVACRTHDYGYDLLRYFDLSGGRRRAVDQFFVRDMKLNCSGRSEEEKDHCLTAANLAFRAIRTSSRIRSYNTPWGSVQA